VLRARDERVLLTGPRLWGAVLGLGVDQLVAWGVLYYAYTILAEPIARDLGVSRVVVAGAFSVSLLAAGWVGRHVGRVVDARGTRDTMRAGALVAPVAFAAIALATGPVTLVAVSVVLGAAQALCLYDPAFRTVVDWCAVEPTRSRALLLLTSIGGFASTVFLPLAAWLVGHHDWRAAVVVLALLLAIVLVPGRLVLPLPALARAPVPTTPAPALPSERMLAIGLVLHAVASTGVFVSLTWHLVERGDSVAEAAAIAGLAGAAQVPGRLLAGPLRRCIGPAAFLPWLMVVQALATLGVAVADGPIATVCVVALGGASGVVTLERAALLVERYGRETFGARQGRLSAATNTARAIAPFVVEAGHQRASYATMFGALAVSLAVAACACRAADHR
jgi:MFS family permease